MGEKKKSRKVGKMLIYTVYILCIFFPEFSKEKLGCTHYLKQGW